MFDISYIGLDHAHAGDFVYGDGEHDWWLLLHIKTSALFHLSTGDVVAPANSSILFPPHKLAYYEACEEQFVNSYIRFHTDELCVTGTNIPLCVPFMLKNPWEVEKIFELISSENYWKQSGYEKNLGLLLKLLMNKLEESVDIQEVPTHKHILSVLRYEIQMNPAFPWTVKAMADRVHISPGYLQNLYRKQFGIPCMQDVVNARIALAKEHLRSTDASSQRISQLCGYQSVEHFCRQFKNETGMPPMKYRKLAREGAIDN